MISTVEHLTLLTKTKVPTIPFQQPNFNPHQQHKDLISNMMSAEFARPLPKPKYNIPSTTNPNNNINNDINTSNIDSLRSKYSEQRSPVNLALGQISQCTKEQMSDDQKEIVDVVGLGITSSQLPFPTSPALGTNAYPSLNYYRYPPGIFSPFHRPPYIPQINSYHHQPPFLPAYSQMQGSMQSQPQHSHSRQNNQMSVTLNQCNSSTLMNASSGMSLLKERDLKNTGTKSDNHSSCIDFKSPSDSLKHHYLTARQFVENEIKTTRLPISNNSLVNFTKGSLIELANGDHRRVEDLRTEDFISSAEKSSDLQLADSTVVKILNTTTFENCVVITFSYDKNQSKIDIEATNEQPFFIYGQGWASCNPEGSQKIFGLKCQRLQVGDVCISLKPRRSSRKILSDSDIYAQDENSQLPQNLSKRTHFSTSSSLLQNDTQQSYLQQQMKNISDHYNSRYNYNEQNKLSAENESPFSKAEESEDINDLLSKKRRCSD